MVAMKYATTYPEHPSKLILQSTRSRLDTEGLVRAFEERGGAKAARVARAYWSRGGPETLAEYGVSCAPLYGPSPTDPDEVARMTVNVELLTDETTEMFLREFMEQFEQFMERVFMVLPRASGELSS